MKVRMLTRLVSLTLFSWLVACGGASEHDIAGPLAALRTAPSSGWSEPVDLGPAINTADGAQNATLSQDRLRLYFTSTRPSEVPGVGGADIWVSKRPHRNAPWGEPVNLGFPVNTQANDVAPDLSPDGHWLFFHSNRPGGVGAAPDIWVSYRQNVHDDFGWEMPANLGPGVNTVGPDNAPSYVENGGTHAPPGRRPQLLFTRGPPLGNSDIWVSELNLDGSWGQAVPVTELNSPERDGSPSVSPSGLVIYFDSNRIPGNPVRTHLFVATRRSIGDPWDPPDALEPPIFTTDGEALPFVLFRGGLETLVYTRDLRHDNVFSLWQSTRMRGEGNRDDNDEADR